MSKQVDAIIARLVKEIGAGNFDKAIDTADSAIAIDIACANAYLYKAAALQKKKLMEDSVPVLQEGIKYSKSKQTRMAFIKGLITAYEKTDTDESLQSLAELYINEAIIEISDKNESKATEYINKAFAIYDNYSDYESICNAVEKLISNKDKIAQKEYKAYVHKYLQSIRDGCINKDVSVLLTVSNIDFAHGNSDDLQIANERILLLAKEIQSIESTGFANTKRDVPTTFENYASLFTYIWREDKSAITVELVQKYASCYYNVYQNSNYIAYMDVDKEFPVEVMSKVEQFIKTGKFTRNQYNDDSDGWVLVHNQNINSHIYKVALLCSSLTA